MSAIEIVRLMNREDRKVPLAVWRELPKIARAVETMAAALRKGGRVFYVGAGSSGRMGVLDAAECPPTFGISRQIMRAVIAGGRRAIERAVEGAEDAPQNAAKDLRAQRLGPRDVVVGITASGTTPYVRGALEFSQKRRAATVLVTSNQGAPLARLANIVIAPQVGPEVLTGSTRLKAGTAQKMVLNMLSTAVMTRLGHVYENFMIDAKPTNEKVRKRGIRILAEASGKSVSQAEDALRQSGHNLRVALLALNLGISERHARTRLRAAGGSLRKALSDRRT